MRKTPTFFARVLRVLAVVTLLPLVTTPVVPPDSPYLSALSELTVATLSADPPCENKDCDTSTTPVKCKHRQGFQCAISPSGEFCTIGVAC